MVGSKLNPMPAFPRRFVQSRAGPTDWLVNGENCYNQGCELLNNMEWGEPFSNQN
jgi:hypothetical protein